MTKRYLAWMALFVALVLTGCGGGGGDSAPKPELFFVNASPDAGALQLRLDDNVTVANIDYLGRSTSFFEVDFRGPDVEGYDVSIHEQASPNLELQRITQVFQNNTDNIVLVHGLRTFGAEDLKRLRIATFPVNRKLVNGNRARLIVVHAFEDKSGFGTPSMVFKTPGDNAQFQTGTVNVGANTTLEVDSGTAVWEVRRAGTEFVYATASLAFDPGGVYLIVVSGVEGSVDNSKDVKITAVSLPTIL